MSSEILAFIILFSLSIIIPVFVVGIYQGIKKCYNNDAMGVLILFIIFLNIFGLIGGLAILYNYRHNVNIKKNEDNDENITELLTLRIKDTTYFLNKHLIIKILNINFSLRGLYLKQNSFK